MDILILNSELLNNIIQSNSLTLMKKFQRGKNGLNYFLIPNIGVKLFNVKVTWVDPFKKNLSFSINRWENPNLITLLRHINTSLSELYKNMSYSNLNVAPFFFEKGDYIYIRTYLPNTNGKYHIHNNLGNFIVPRKDSTFDSITIYFKNIWEDDTKAGFNIELKEVETKL
jgi:hypothetical protein